MVDTIEAAIAIAFHNIAVQQMSCGLLEDAGKSSASALGVGKKCIEEWHPWIRQMETTHLAAVKLTGGFPSMADMSDVIVPPAELDHRAPLPRDAEPIGGGGGGKKASNNSGRRRSGGGGGRGRGRGGRAGLHRLPTERGRGGDPYRAGAQEPRQRGRGRGRPGGRKRGGGGGGGGNTSLPYLESNSVDPEVLREMRGPPRYRSPREQQYSDEEGYGSGEERRQYSDESGDEPPHGAGRRAWQSGEVQQGYSDEESDGESGRRGGGHDGQATRIVDWPVDDEAPHSARSGRSSARSDRSGRRSGGGRAPPAFQKRRGRPETPESMGSRGSHLSADMFDGDTDWNAKGGF